MGAGLFLTRKGDVTWWSHGGSVDGFESLLAGSVDSRFAVIVMTNGPGGGSFAMELAAHLGEQHGPAAVFVNHLTGEGIRAAIRMATFNEQAVGSYLLPSGLRIDMSLSAPDRHGGRTLLLALPSQPTIEPAWPFTDGHWRIPGLEAVVVYEHPDRLRLLHAGREVVATRVTT
jgi:hypothetical protein